MNTEQVKFIIFGQSRSGSTLLKELLDSHPDIHCDGELFNPAERYIRSKILLKFFTLFPHYLIKYYYKQFSNKIYGFTLFLYHLHHVDKRLQDLSKAGWKIIYLRRKNIVNQALSNIIARQRGFYHRIKDKSAFLSEKVVVSPENLIEEMKCRVMWNKKAIQLLRGLPYLEVVYEDNLEDSNCWPDTMKMLFEYLGTFYIPTTSKLVKTYPKPYSEIITNYNELRDAVKNSEVSYSLTYM